MSAESGWTISDVVEAIAVKLSEYGYEADDRVDHGTMRSRLDGGVDAAFIKLDNQTGFKFYYSQPIAENNFVLQSYVYTKNLAPRAWGLTSFTAYGHTYYGFFTQVAEIAADRYGWHNSFNIPLDARRLLEDMRGLLEKSLELIGLDDSDMHLKNWGFIGRNLVIIDFSNSSSSLNMDELKAKALIA